MSEISPGMKVKCIKDGWKGGAGPAPGEVLIVKGFLPKGGSTSVYRCVRWDYLCFAKWDLWFPVICFRPLDQIDELEETIKAIPESVDA